MLYAITVFDQSTNQVLTNAIIHNDILGNFITANNGTSTINTPTDTPYTCTISAPNYQTAILILTPLTTAYNVALNKYPSVFSEVVNAVLGWFNSMNAQGPIGLSLAITIVILSFVLFVFFIQRI